MTELQQFEDRMVRIAAGTAHTVQHAEAQPPELAAGREHLLLAFERRDVRSLVAAPALVVARS